MKILLGALPSPSPSLRGYAAALMESCWLLALIAAPLFFDAHSARLFEPDKTVVLRIVAMLALAAWLLGRPRLRWRQPVVWAAIGLAAAQMLSSALSIAPMVSLWGTYGRLQGLLSSLAYGVLFAVTASALRRRDQAERLIMTVILASLPVSLYGLSQRWGLDPIPWSGDGVGVRATSTLGNPNFVGAYLIMAVPLMLGRWLAGQRLLPGLCLIAALLAIAYTASRGSQLGLLAGVLFFGLLLAAHRRRPRWAALALGGALAALVFIGLLNLPDGPLRGLRELPGWARLAHLREELQGGGTGRALIWGGVVDLLVSGRALWFPDGSLDSWSAGRLWIGYGPETLGMAFGPHYPAALLQNHLVDARDALPDRAHNEVLDVLAASGLAGLAAWLALWTALFAQALDSLGLLGQRKLFWALLLGGGAAGAAAAVAALGLPFVGIGLPFGLLLGLALYLARQATRPVGALAGWQDWRAIASISLLAALLAHFVEIQFGIAAAATRAQFWIFLGALLGIAAGESPPAPASPAAASVRNGGLLALLLCTLVFDFFGSPVGLAPVWPMPPPAWLWILGSAGLLAGMAYGLLGVEDRPVHGKSVALVAGLAVLIAGGYGGLQAHRLAGLAALAPLSAEDWAAWAAGSAELPFLYVATVLLLVCLMAGVDYLRRADWPAWLAAAGLLAVAIIAARLNLRVVQADILHKTAAELDAGGRPEAAIPLLQREQALAPWEAQYPLLAGAVYANAARRAPTTEQRDEFFAQGEQALHKALRLNPLNVDNLLFLAYLNRQWGSLAGDPAKFQAADRYYASAARLNPQDVGLWNAWAELAWQSQNDFARAEARLKQSLGINAQDHETWQDLADLYAWQARQDGGQAEAWLARAVQTYRQGIQRFENAWTEDAAQRRAQRLSVSTLPPNLAHPALLRLQLGLAEAYLALRQYAEALTTYQDMAGQGAGDRQWQVLRACAELSAHLGKPGDARAYARQALALAPADQRPGLQRWLDGLP